jgi:hypothetical protein
MNKIIVILLIGALGIGGVANAQAIPEGTKSMGFEISGGDDGLRFIKGSYFTKEDLAIRLGIGFVDSDDVELIAFSIGIRSYFEGKNAVKPFVGADVKYASGSETISDEFGDSFNEDVDIFQVEGNFGFEFFFRENISLEASVGLRLTSTDSDGDDEEIISTFSSGSGYGVGAALNIFF